jgi:hypothetical protein
MPELYPLGATAPEAIYLTIAQVAERLVVSEATATDRFENLDGVIDMGAPASMHKRRRRALRVPLRTFQKYVADHQVKVKPRRPQK